MSGDFDKQAITSLKQFRLKKNDLKSKLQKLVNLLQLVGVDLSEGVSSEHI